MLFSGFAGACVLTLIGFVCGQAYGRGFLVNVAKAKDSKRHPVKRSAFDANEHIRPNQLAPKSGKTINKTFITSIRNGSILQRTAFEALPPLKPNQGGTHRQGLEGATDQVFKAEPELMVPRRGPPIPKIEIATEERGGYGISPFTTTLEAIGKKRMALDINDLERSREQGTTHNIVQEGFKTQLNREVIYVPGNVALVPSTRLKDTRPLPFFSDE